MTKYKVTTTAVLVLGIAIAALCFLMARPNRCREDISLNFAIIIFGACCGWVVGILLSPYSEKEKTIFEEYASAISAFVSGYLVAKIDESITLALTPGVLSMPLVGFRVMIFSASLILGAVMTIATRKYGLDADSLKDPEAETKDES